MFLNSLTFWKLCFKICVENKSGINIQASIANKSYLNLIYQVLYNKDKSRPTSFNRPSTSKNITNWQPQHITSRIINTWSSLTLVYVIMVLYSYDDLGANVTLMHDLEVTTNAWPWGCFSTKILREPRFPPCPPPWTRWWRGWRVHFTWYCSYLGYCGRPCRWVGYYLNVILFSAKKTKFWGRLCFIALLGYTVFLLSYSETLLVFQEENLLTVWNKSGHDTWNHERCSCEKEKKSYEEMSLIK